MAFLPQRITIKNKTHNSANSSKNFDFKKKDLINHFWMLIFLLTGSSRSSPHHSQGAQSFTKKVKMIINSL